MRDTLPWRRACAAALIPAALAMASAATASRVGSGAPAAPSASAVQAGAAQPAHVQADESASLRQGTIGALDNRRGLRVQVQGLWLDVVDGQTQLVRDGRPAALDSLKAGEAIRFTVTAGTGGTAPAMKVIYAP